MVHLLWSVSRDVQVYCKLRQQCGQCIPSRYVAEHSLMPLKLDADHVNRIHGNAVLLVLHGCYGFHEQLAMADVASGYQHRSEPRI